MRKTWKRESLPNPLGALQPLLKLIRIASDDKEAYVACHQRLFPIEAQRGKVMVQKSHLLLAGQNVCFLSHCMPTNATERSLRHVMSHKFVHECAWAWGVRSTLWPFSRQIIDNFHAGFLMIRMRVNPKALFFANAKMFVFLGCFEPVDSENPLSLNNLFMQVFAKTPFCANSVILTPKLQLR